MVGNQKIDKGARFLALNIVEFGGKLSKYLINTMNVAVFSDKILSNCIHVQLQKFKNQDDRAGKIHRTKGKPYLKLKFRNIKSICTSLKFQMIN